MIKKISPYGITTSKEEVRDLIKAWFVVAITFAILYSKDFLSTDFFWIMLFSSLTAGPGFLLHELAHKIVAQHYGCKAEFRSFDTYLFLSILLSFFGILILAPGAVFIEGEMSRTANGKISVAGPLMNIVLAVFFFLLRYYEPLSEVSYFGVLINAWLAIFNMIPIFMFDGAKVWKWNKGVWLMVVVAGGVLLFVNSLML